MKKLSINDLKNMFRHGVNKIALNAEYINQLNVFPVPDGDTGTNMKVTSINAFEEVKNLQVNDISIFGQAFSRALLMNARGNSGVIFSQIMKGFVSGFRSGETHITHDVLLSCFHNAKDVAYKAVANPVEGTILTVIRVIDEDLQANVSKLNSVFDVFSLAKASAKKALDNTPELLPELKKVGVVDSGGYGLWCFITGMCDALSLKSTKALNFEGQEEGRSTQPLRNHQTSFDDHDYQEEFGYCSEVILKINSRISPDDNNKQEFYLEQFKNELLKIGNSLVCVQDNDIVKVHVHTKTPGVFLNVAQKYGEFYRIKIENMTEQFYNRLKNEGVKVIDTLKTKPLEIKLTNKLELVLTCPSLKIKKILTSDYGFKHVMCTEKTGNPSIQDILMAVQKTKSKNVIFVTDDSNIVLAANQAVSILKPTVNLIVIKGSNIFEALLASLEFDPSNTMENNEKQMNKIIKQSYSALISRSVKSVTYSDISFAKDDFIGMVDKKIIAADVDEYKVLKQIIDSLMSKAKHADVLMIFYDSKKRMSVLKKIEEYVNNEYNLFCEFKEGGQKVYCYYIGLQ